MAVPKRKTSKARRDKRKSANMKMKAPGLSICPQCHEPKLPHRVCPNCITTVRMLWNLQKHKQDNIALKLKRCRDLRYRF